MAQYIGLFSSQTELQAALDSKELLPPYVAYIEATSGVSFNTETPVYPGEVLTTGLSFSSLESTINVYINESEYNAVYFSSSTSDDWLSLNDVEMVISGRCIEVTASMNETGQVREGSVTVTFYADGSHSQIRNIVVIGVTQAIPSPEEYKKIVLTFEPSVANQKMRIMNVTSEWFIDIQINGTSIKPAIEDDYYYTFAEAGVYNVSFYADYINGSFANTECSKAWVGRGANYTGNYEMMGGINGTYTFVDCTQLSWVTISEGCTRIDGHTFSGCTALLNIELDCANKPSVYNREFTTIKDLSGGVLYTLDGGNWTNSGLYNPNWTVRVGPAATVTFEGGLMTMTKPYDYTPVTYYIHPGAYAKVLGGGVTATSDTTVSLTMSPNTAGHNQVYSQNFTVYQNMEDSGASFSYRISPVLTRTSNPNAINFAIVEKFTTSEGDMTRNVVFTSSNARVSATYLNDASTNYEDSAITISSANYTFDTAGEHTIKFVMDTTDGSISSMRNGAYTEVGLVNIDPLTEHCKMRVQADTVRSNPNLTTLRIAAGTYSVDTNFVTTRSSDVSPNFNKIIVEGTTMPLITNASGAVVTEFNAKVQAITGTLEVATGVDTTAWETALGSNWTVVRV